MVTQHFLQTIKHLFSLLEMLIAWLQMSWNQQIAFVAECTDCIVVKIQFICVFFLKILLDVADLFFFVNDKRVTVFDTCILFDEVICPVDRASLLQEKHIDIIFKQVLKNPFQFDLYFALGFGLFILQVVQQKFWIIVFDLLFKNLRADSLFLGFVD